MSSCLPPKPNQTKTSFQGLTPWRLWPAEIARDIRLLCQDRLGRRRKFPIPSHLGELPRAEIASHFLLPGLSSLGQRGPRLVYVLLKRARRGPRFGPLVCIVLCPWASLGLGALSETGLNSQELGVAGRRLAAGSFLSRSTLTSVQGQGLGALFSVPGIQGFLPTCALGTCRSSNLCCVE